MGKKAAPGLARAPLPRVAFALGEGPELEALRRAPSGARGWCEPLFPADLAEIERLHSSDALDAIVTDFSWAEGSLADWIQLWPQPCLILIDPGADPSRVEWALRDESSAVLLRDPAGGHLALIPAMVRKVVNIRESLTRQNAHVQTTERQYLNLVQAIPDIVYTLDDQGRFLYLNDAVRALGHDPGGLVGRHFSALVEAMEGGAADRETAIARYRDLRERGGPPPPPPKLFDERRAGHRMTRDLTVRLRHAAGWPFDAVGARGEEAPDPLPDSWGEVSCAGYRLPPHEGGGLGTIGIIRDVSERLERERALEAALGAKEVLLKEIHHRVKNNLQVVSSLLHLRELAVEDEDARLVLVECQNQVHSMAMVHEVLYRTEDFEGVLIGPYLERLLSYLAEVYDAAGHGIEIEVDAGEGRLGLDEAIPTALIATELVSNSFKYAFPDFRPGKLRVSLRVAEGSWILEVEDDGIGIDAGKDHGRERGVGTDLVAALSSQLHGDLEVSVPGSGVGTLNRVVFPAVPAAV